MNGSPLHPSPVRPERCFHKHRFQCKPDVTDIAATTTTTITIIAITHAIGIGTIIATNANANADVVVGDGVVDRCSRYRVPW